MARDPFGLVPFYEHDRTAVTSHCLYDLLDKEPGLDRDALLEYVLFGDIWSEATMFAGIRRVVPAFSPPSTELTDREGRELVDLFWRTLGDAVARAIGSASGEIVVAISGGIDAAALAAVAVERLGASRVRAATVGQANEPETRAARASADALGIPLTIIEPDDRVVEWPRHALWPTLPQTATERSWEAATRDGIVLWGIGGDSLQRGDRQHYVERVRQRQLLRGVTDLVRSVALHGCKPALGFRAALRHTAVPGVPEFIVPTMGDAAAAISARRAGQTVFRRGVDEMFAPAWRWFFEWMASQHNDPPIEHRFPFFDEELVTLMATIPTAPWCVDKNLLRAALRRRLPDRVRLRPKSPAASPAQISWGREFADVINEELASSAYTTARIMPGTFGRARVEGLLRCAAATRWERQQVEAKTEARVR